MTSRRQLYALGEPFGEACTRIEGRRLICGGGGGSKAPSNTTTTTKPWKELQPYMIDLYKQASEWNQSAAPEYFPESTVAFGDQPYAESPESKQARELMTQRATAGSPLLRQSQEQLSNTMSGQFLDPSTNPQLLATYNAATAPMLQNWQNVVNPGIASQFAAGGRYGSGQQAFALERGQGQLAQGLATTAAGIYGPAYENERQRQQAAMLNAPSFAEADYADISRLGGIGQNLEQRQQQILNDKIARFEFGQNRGLNKLQAYNSILQGSPYTTQTARGAGGGGGGGFSPMGAISGAATAYGLGSTLGIGGLGGAAAGGLAAIGPVGWGALALGALAGSGVFG